MENSSELDVQLLSRFGLQNFRPGQTQVLETVLRGEDCLCIMPTGGGKSLCFQYPALAREGMVIVVSPLIALMKDQVDSLVQRGIPATFINSSLTYNEQLTRCEAMVAGQFNLVYVAPERLRNAGFLEFLSQTRLQLLAIDEAHCISQWGHDFRPDYARIGRFRQRIGNIQTIALTATATTTVRDDIIEVLGLRSPKVFVTDFARNNLSLSMVEVRSDAEKDRLLLEFLKRNAGAGIVYSSTRKGCEHIDELLQQSTSRRVAYYHAGLESKERKEIQENFIHGKTEVIVATNAFGMGIDKPDVRFVVHYNLPGSIEAYYQEAGRAGRDGLPSNCLMLHGYRDSRIQEFFIENAYPSPAIVEAVYEYLRGIDADPIEMTLQDIKDDLHLPVGVECIRVCENLLEKAGVLERMDVAQNLASIRINSQLPTTVELIPREARNQRRVVRALEKIVGDLRNERIYFHLGAIIQQTGLGIEAFNRAIRAINQLDVFDYVPPFRGRAVHMRERSRPFAQLNIDFKELDRRKEAEYARLNQIMDLARTNKCRQVAILKYFGDPDQTVCTKCDNCSMQGHTPSTPFDSANSGSLYAIQVVISGAVRVNGRAGRNIIAQMLAGSRAKKVKQLGLDKLSTFGLLNGLTLDEIASLINTLIDGQLLIQEDIQKFRPVIKPSELGQQVIKGLRIPDLDRLLDRAFRDRLNHCFKDKRPFLPNSDSTINNRDRDAVNEARVGTHQPANIPEVKPSLDRAEPIASHVVGTGDDALRVEYITDIRLDLQSDAECSSQPALDVVSAGSLRSNPSFSLSPESHPLPFELNRHTPSYYWSWHLLSSGFDLATVCRIRNIDEDNLISDLIRSREIGLPIDLSWLASIDANLAQASGETEQRFWERLDRLGSSRISPKLKLLLAKCEPENLQP
ncbi:MAG TPA: ATP-dependent DNA helicase RecQ [Pirellulaceae bacterium]|mgnify:CR=1 FL=1|nr:ATP-dependent DNA helicase RecQ [Pirellulaceae bacterium]HMO91149.1 ATP-dependent DNA helicase RecQ [Pirellulaceae bacterium]HMP69080.1 ATP-dependent DNA helicase RecQ [Pirellulaceae bacterium]